MNRSRHPNSSNPAVGGLTHVDSGFFSHDSLERRTYPGLFTSDGAKTGKMILPSSGFRSNFAPKPYPIIRESRKLLERLLKLRETVNGRTIFVTNDRRRYVDEQRILLEALSHFLDTAEASVTSRPTTENVPQSEISLYKSWSRVQKLAEQFRSHGLALQKEEHELILLENRLLRKEQEVYQRVSRARDDISSSEDADGELSDADESLSSKSHSSESHPLIKEYYEILGKINLLRDGLVNFEARHQHRSNNRDWKRAKGEPVNPPDSTFIQDHLRKRKTRVQELVMAREELDRLATLCAEQNLDVENPNLPPLAEDDLLNQLNRIPQSFIDHIASTTPGPEEANDVSALLVGHSDTESRIADWLNQVDSGLGDLSTVHEHYLKAGEQFPTSPYVPHT